MTFPAGPITGPWGETNSPWISKSYPAGPPTRPSSPGVGPEGKPSFPGISTTFPWGPVSGPATSPIRPQGKIVFPSGPTVETEGKIIGQRRLEDGKGSVEAGYRCVAIREAGFMTTIPRRGTRTAGALFEAVICAGGVQSVVLDRYGVPFEETARRWCTR